MRRRILARDSLDSIIRSGVHVCTTSITIAVMYLSSYLPLTTSPGVAYPSAEYRLLIVLTVLFHTGLSSLALAGDRLYGLISIDILFSFPCSDSIGTSSKPVKLQIGT